MAPPAWGAAATGKAGRTQSLPQEGEEEDDAEPTAAADISDFPSLGGGKTAKAQPRGPAPKPQPRGPAPWANKGLHTTASSGDAQAAEANAECSAGASPSEGEAEGPGRPFADAADCTNVGDAAEVPECADTVGTGDAEAEAAVEQLEETLPEVEAPKVDDAAAFPTLGGPASSSSSRAKAWGPRAAKQEEDEKEAKSSTAKSAAAKSVASKAKKAASKAATAKVASLPAAAKTANTKAETAVETPVARAAPKLRGNAEPLAAEAPTEEASPETSPEVSPEALPEVAPQAAPQLRVTPAEQLQDFPSLGRGRGGGRAKAKAKATDSPTRPASAWGRQAASADSTRQDVPAVGGSEGAVEGEADARLEAPASVATVPAAPADAAPAAKVEEEIQEAPVSPIVTPALAPAPVVDESSFPTLASPVSQPAASPKLTKAKVNKAGRKKAAGSASRLPVARQASNGSEGDFASCEGGSLMASPVGGPASPSRSTAADSAIEPLPAGLFLAGLDGAEDDEVEVEAEAEASTQRLEEDPVADKDSQAAITNSNATAPVVPAASQEEAKPLFTEENVEELFPDLSAPKASRSGVKPEESASARRGKKPAPAAAGKWATPLLGRLGLGGKAKEPEEEDEKCAGAAEVSVPAPEVDATDAPADEPAFEDALEDSEALPVEVHPVEAQRNERSEPAERAELEQAQMPGKRKASAKKNVASQKPPGTHAPPGQLGLSVEDARAKAEAAAARDRADASAAKTAEEAKTKAAAVDEDLETADSSPAVPAVSPAESPIPTDFEPSDEAASFGSAQSELDCQSDAGDVSGELSTTAENGASGSDATATTPSQSASGSGGLAGGVGLRPTSSKVPGAKVSLLSGGYMGPRKGAIPMDISEILTWRELCSPLVKPDDLHCCFEAEAPPEPAAGSRPPRDPRATSGAGAGRGDQRSGAGAGRGARSRGGRAHREKDENLNLEPVAPLEVSSSSWVCQQKQYHTKERSAEGGEDGQRLLSDEDITRRVRSILNKLTKEKFQALLRQLMDCGLSTQEHVEILMHEVMEKATTQHHFIPMYTELCTVMHKWCIENEIGDSGKGFKRILLTECQSSFERYLKPPAHLKDLKGDDFTEAEFKYKTAMIGNIRFVGSLLREKMLASSVIIAVTTELMSDLTNLEALESLAAFLTTVGGLFDRRDWTHHAAFNNVFRGLEKISKDGTVPSRIRCLFTDVLDLRLAGWEDQKIATQRETGPMTLDEVKGHSQARAAVKGGKSRGGRGAVPAAAVERDGWQKASSSKPRGGGASWQVAGHGPPGAHAIASRPAEAGAPAKGAAAPRGAADKAVAEAVPAEQKAPPRPWKAAAAAPWNRGSEASASPTQPQRAPPRPQAELDIEQLRRQLKAVVKELTVSHDVADAVECVSELQIPTEYHAAEFAHIIVQFAEEANPASRAVGFRLVVQLFVDGVFEKSELRAALDKLLGKSFEDLRLDNPFLPTCLKDECLPALKELIAAGLITAEQHEDLARRLE